MIPVYIPPLIAPEPGVMERLLTEIPWESRAETRRECFMTPGVVPYTYTYGQGRGVRDYTSIPMSDFVAEILNAVNFALSSDARTPGWGPMTGCFLNCYEDDHDHLGWHADDFRGMDHTRAVVSVSYGEAREIWWRKFGESGEVPVENRRLLASGSIFVMPPGMQFTHQHRIPKGSRKMGPRVSLTFRAFLEGA